MEAGAATPAVAPSPPRLAGRLGRWAHALPLALALLLFLPGFFSLPPTDRDESRFAQATKQMLETGDFVDIRFQDVARHKKPVGIYWLQAAAAAPFGGAKAPIWAFRIPSLLGALAAVWLTAVIGASLFGPAAGLLGGAILAGSLLLNVEARIATTDAVLLACILAAQFGLVKAWLARSAGRRDRAALPWRDAAPFWLGIGLGVLVKGPIVILVTGGTAAWLALAARDARWLAALRPAAGLLLAVVIAAPWFVLISVQSHGAFLQESVGQDLLSKVFAGVEGKGFPPGYYTLLLHQTFWPSVWLLLPALAWAWAKRREPAVQFCIAWAAPTWLVFEAVPTKLFHYVLPAYPALALLAAAGCLDGALRSHPRLALLGVGLTVLVALEFAAASAAGPIALSLGFDPAGAAVGIALACFAVFAGWIAWRDRGTLYGPPGKPWDPPGKPWEPLRAVAPWLGTAVAAYALAFGHLLPSLSPLWVGRNLAAAAAAHAPCPRSTLAAAGYAEPSLVFLSGTRTRLTDAEGAANHLLADPECALAAVGAAERPAFEAALSAAGRQALSLATVSGLNYTKGRPVELGLFRLR